MDYMLVTGVCASQQQVNFKNKPNYCVGCAEIAAFLIYTISLNVKGNENGSLSCPHSRGMRMFGYQHIARHFYQMQSTSWN